MVSWFVAFPTGTTIDLDDPTIWWNSLDDLRFNLDIHQIPGSGDAAGFFDEFFDFALTADQLPAFVYFSGSLSVANVFGAGSSGLLIGTINADAEQNVAVGSGGVLIAQTNIVNGTIGNTTTAVFSGGLAEIQTIYQGAAAEGGEIVANTVYSGFVGVSGTIIQFYGPYDFSALDNFYSQRSALYDLAYAAFGGTFVAAASFGGIDAFSGGTVRVSGDTVVGFGQYTSGIVPAGDGSLSLQSYSYDSMEVNGQGSAFTGSTIESGTAGPGWIEVDNGGTLIANTITLSGVTFTGPPVQPIVVSNAQLTQGPLEAAAGLPGLLTVSDPGSSVTVKNLTIGSDGSLAIGGTVDVVNGATLNAQQITLDSGTIEVDGSGSGLFVKNGGALVVGEAATGVLAIDDGATVVASSLDIAAQPTGGTAMDPSDVVVWGQGSSLRVGNLTVGDAGDGDLLISHDATVTVGDSLTVGAQSGGGGTMIVQGEAVLRVGGDVVLGDSEDADATVSITDDGAELDAAGNLFIGENGEATVSIDDDAVADVAGSLILGDGETGNGTLTVANGATLKVEGQDIVIGEDGTAELTVEDGSTLDAQNANITVADQEDSQGTLTVQDSTLKLNSLTLGEGDAHVTIADSEVEINQFSNDISQAQNSGSGNSDDAALTIDHDSTVIVLGAVTLTDMDLDVDDPGASLVANQKWKLTGGSLALTDGNDLFNNGLDIEQTATVKTAQTSSSTLKVRNGLYIGQTQQASLTISGTGALVDTDYLYLGASAASGNPSTVTVANRGTLKDRVANINSGSVLVNGGTWTNSNAIDLGSATLQLSNHAQVTALNINVVSNASTFATIIVDSTSSLNVGSTASAGAVTIGGGQSLSLPEGLVNAYALSDYGTVDVGTLVLNGPGALAGTGSLTIETVGDFSSGGTIGTLIDNGALNLNGNITVDNVFENANWGTIDSFNPMAGITNGLILAPQSDASTNDIQLTTAPSPLTLNYLEPIVAINSTATTKYINFFNISQDPNLFTYNLTLPNVPKTNLAFLQASAFYIYNSSPTLTITLGIDNSKTNLNIGQSNQIYYLYGITPGGAPITLAPGQSQLIVLGTIQAGFSTNVGGQVTLETNFSNMPELTINPLYALGAPAAAALIPLLLSTVAPVNNEVSSGTVQLAFDSGNGDALSVTGTPTLSLNDGGTATYDAAASNLAQGQVVFDYTIAAGQHTNNLEVTSINLASVTDIEGANGGSVDFTDVANAPTGIQIGAAYVASVTPSQTGEADAGTTVQITVQVSEGITVDTTNGSPTLTLSDNGTATYDTASSNPSAGTLVFDYMVGANDHSPDLSVASLNPNGATIEDPNGVAVDFSAIGTPTGLQIGPSPLTVTSVGAVDDAQTGELQITLIMSEACALQDDPGNPPALALNDGGTAFYDSAASDPAAGTLVFEYVVGEGDITPNLEVSSISLNGATIQDTNGFNADFGNALNSSTDLEIGAVSVLNLNASQPTGDISTSQTLTLTAYLDGGVAVTGMPELELSDGGVAIYDAQESDPANGVLAFDYTAGANDFTTDLQVTGFEPNGGSIVDENGLPADLSGAVEDLGLGVNATIVKSVTASPSGQAVTGQTVQFTLDLSGPVTVTGAPALALSDGESAAYDANASDPANGILVFGYTVQAGDQTTNLEITAVDPAVGDSISDGNGHAVDFSASLDTSLGLQIGPSPLTVTSVAPSQTGSVGAGQTIQLTLTMSEAVTIDSAGGPLTLDLNDGATAHYDLTLSNPAAGTLVFDYTVGPSDSTADLQVTSVNLPSGTTARDASGNNANFAAALNTGLDVEVGPPQVTEVFASHTGEVDSGQTIQITLAMSTPQTVTGSPTLTLSDGATATYDPGLSSATDLVFDYMVGSNDATPDLELIGVNLPAGTTVADSATGVAPSFADALDTNLGVRIGPSLLTVTGISSSQTLQVDAGQELQITLTMAENATVSTAGGVPFLSFNDGAIATYDAAASSGDDLVFDYTVGVGDYTTDLQIANVNVNGATITDTEGYSANFGAAENYDLGVEIGLQPNVVSVSPGAPEADAGQTVQLAITLSEGVTVTGTPTLSLSDGATATYDADASDPSAGMLVFDYTVGATDGAADLEITTVNTGTGVSVVDAGGRPANFAAALNVDTGLQIGPAYVTSVASSTNEIFAGGTAELTFNMSENVTLDTSNGTPFLVLSDGAVASFDAAATAALDGDSGGDDPSGLVFDYTAGPTDASPDLEITKIDLNGATATDDNGVNADLDAALDSPTGLQVGPSPLTVTNITSFPNTGEADAGQTVQVTLTMSEAVTVDPAGGLPMLHLLGGGSATYNANESDPANGVLVFDYTVGASDSSTDLVVTGVELPSGTTAQDASGYNADFSSVATFSTAVQIGPLTAGPIGVSAPEAQAGQTVQLTVGVDGPVAVDASGGLPTLSLNSGGTAIYDAQKSNPSSGVLVYDYTVAATDQDVPYLEVTGVNLPTGTTIEDDNGVAVNFSGTLGSEAALQIGPTEVVAVQASPTGVASAGQAIELTILTSSPVVVAGGTPTLVLNDGGTASYDASASQQLGDALVFDYTVGANDQTPNLEITSIKPNDASINDNNGVGVNLSGALDVPTGLQVGASPLTVEAVTPSQDLAGAGETVQLTLAMSEAVTVTGGGPLLKLSNGATAIYDVQESTPSNGTLAFDYTVGGNDQTTDVSIIGVDQAGATVQDADGYNADFSDAFDSPIGLELTPVVADFSSTSPTGVAHPGQTVALTVWLNEGVTVGGDPSLQLNNGASAAYNANVSDPTSGELVFDYAIPAGDPSPGLEITGVDLTDSFVQNVAGYNADFSGIENVALGVDITPCYCRGTLIQTQRGQKSVERLRIGDRVRTKSGAARPIKWIGRRSYGGRFVAGRKDTLPVCIRAGALDENIPRRDLWVSPHHAMYLDGVLIEAKDLINGVSIVQAEQVRTVEYFHIELDSHDVIIAEGALSETFIDDDSRGMFHNAQEYETLYAEELPSPAFYCAPRLEEGYQIDVARRRIALRAGLLRAADPPHIGVLRGYIDFIGEARIEGWAQNADSPEAPLCLDIYADGQLIGRTLANQYRADLACASLGSGYHSFVFVPPQGVPLNCVEVRRSLDGSVLPMSAQAKRIKSLSAA